MSPIGANKDSIISVKVKGVNPSDLSYQWIVNDVAIGGAREDVFRYPKLKKKDRVQVKVSIKGRGEFISEPLIIANIIPQIQSAKLLPQYPKKGDDIKLEINTFDGDGDRVNLTYTWFINGIQVSGETSDMLKGSLIKKGDKVSVRITPSDGEQKGQAITLYAIVANSLPVVSPNIEANINGSTYTSKIKATDPDGDTLIYTLKQSPKGMTINSNGVITWEVSPHDKGEHSIVVSVSDGSGGEVLVPFTTNISLIETPQ